MLEGAAAGCGVAAVVCAVLAAARLASGTSAVSRVAETRVVVSAGRATPFQSTRAPWTKSAPSTVSVKAFPPALAPPGLMAVMLGTGLLTLATPVLTDAVAP